MKKILLLVVCCLPLLGTSCPVQSIGVTCSNTLDASAFGFSLTIPTGFTCTTVQPNSAILVSARYQNSSNGFIASVTLAGPQANAGCNGNPNCTEQNPVVNGNNVTFRLFRVSSTNPAFITYLATTTTTSGNNLGISVNILSSNDDPNLQTTLDTIIQSVKLTQ